jgi:hypothetical protein
VSIRCDIGAALAGPIPRKPLHRKELPRTLSLIPTHYTPPCPPCQVGVMSVYDSFVCILFFYIIIIRHTILLTTYLPPTTLYTPTYHTPD